MNTLEKIAAKYVEFRKCYLDYQEQGDDVMAKIFYNKNVDIVSIVNIISEHVEFWEEVDKIRKNA